MRLFHRLRFALTSPLPHGPSSAGGVADLALRVPEDSADSRRREAVLLYLVPVVLVGAAGVLRLTRHRDEEAAFVLFVLSALSLAGAIAAWLKRWQAGVGWRGSLAVIAGLGLLVAPLCTTQLRPSPYGTFRASFSEVFWALGAVFVATILFTLGRELGQRVRPALLTLPLALVYIEHTPHRAYRWDHHAICQLGHELDAAALDLVALGLCATYVAYVAWALPRKARTRLRPERAGPA